MTCHSNVSHICNKHASFESFVVLAATLQYVVVCTGYTDVQSVQCFSQIGSGIVPCFPYTDTMMSMVCRAESH